MEEIKKNEDRLRELNEIVESELRRERGQLLLYTLKQAKEAVDQIGKEIDELLKEDIKNYPSFIQKTGCWKSVYQGDEIINYRCSECETGETFGKSY